MTQYASPGRTIWVRGPFGALPFHVTPLMFGAEIMTVVRRDAGADAVAVVQNNRRSGRFHMQGRGMFVGLGIHPSRIAQKRANQVNVVDTVIDNFYP